MQPLVDVGADGDAADPELDAVEGRPLGLPVSLIRVSTDLEGDGPALHRHPYAETFVIHRRRALFTIGDETFLARGGQILVAPPLVPHRFRKTGPDRLEMTKPPHPAGPDVAPSMASTSSAAFGWIAASAAIISAARRAPAANAGSSSTRRTAAATRSADAPGGTRTPAPSRTTRVVLARWSRPIGRHTSGTPAASAFMTVPWPACVTTADASRSTSRCGADPTTLTRAEPGTSSGRTARPVVITARTGSDRSATATVRRTSDWRW